jgi:hypothetical protein
LADRENAVMVDGSLVGLKGCDISEIIIEVITLAPSEHGLGKRIHFNVNPVKTKAFEDTGGYAKGEPSELCVYSTDMRALVAACPGKPTRGCFKLLRLMDEQAAVDGCEVMDFDSPLQLDPSFFLRFIMPGHCG